MVVLVSGPGPSVDFGIVYGPDYLVLEYIEGKSLAGPLPTADAVRLAIQIASALEEAHGKGILHRDLKPGNVMVTTEGSAKLLDFGLAKLVADAEATQTMAIMGTPAYMAPEQAEGKPGRDPRHARETGDPLLRVGLLFRSVVPPKRRLEPETQNAAWPFPVTLAC